MIDMKILRIWNGHYFCYLEYMRAMYPTRVDYRVVLRWKNGFELNPHICSENGWDFRKNICILWILDVGWQRKHRTTYVMLHLQKLKWNTQNWPRMEIPTTRFNTDNCLINSIACSFAHQFSSFFTLFNKLYYPRLFPPHVWIPSFLFFFYYFL